MDETVELEYRELLVGLFSATRLWRLEVAQRFPDDLRNRRSAAALDRAGSYALELDEDHPNLRNFAALDRELHDWRGYAPQEIFLEPDVSRAVPSFWFDNEDREPGPRDFESLVARVFRETLERWRETIEDGDDRPPDSLVAFFFNHGVPLWVHDDEEADDAR